MAYYFAARNMMNLPRLIPGATLMLLTAFAGFACGRPSHAATDLPLPEQDLAVEATEGPQTARAVLAGGCFWCTEAVFEHLEGVSAVVSGYAGGSPDTANYSAVSAGRTDHAEVIAIDYDPAVITYGQLLRVFFAVAHDPTQVNRQGNDIGPHYRSAVFYASDEEKAVAEAYIQQLDASGLFDKPIATTLEPLTEFHVAEAYHQDYAVNNPRNPYIVFTAVPKVEKLHKQFPDLLKATEEVAD
ncbi:MAG: peptide-methionine (S)-S-oxide reductase MsrA [Planctomycetota bacterium]